jgi:ribonuclease HII
MRIGVDEAGKGPVLGSMFAAAVRAPADAIPEGVRDSKELSPERREELAGALRGDDRVAVGLAEITPGRIDHPETDMNTLTVAAQSEALAAVAREVDTAYLDAGDVDAARFGRRVGDRVGANVDLHAEHGADAEHPIVAAASVIAKVERDAHVTDLAAEYGAVGSGYPGDPTTRSFLDAYVAEHGRLPECVRASWKTSENALASNGVIDGRTDAETARAVDGRTDAEGGRHAGNQSTLGEF